MKIERLISIILVLLEHEQLSAPKLAEMFEVTPRTIYRDISVIESAGIPIVTTTGVNGGISIMEQYKVDKKYFSMTDISTLLIGLDSISPALSQKDLIHTLAKVKSLTPQEQTKDIEVRANQIVIDLASWGGHKDLQKHLEQIKEGLNENKQLQFNYSDRGGQKSQRIVEPYQLLLKDGSWYVQAYCLLREDFRVFKIARVSELEIRGVHFIPRIFEDRRKNKPPWIVPKVPVTLRVDNTMRDQVMEHCGKDSVMVDEGETSLVTFDFPCTDFAYNTLLSFGNKCECLEPAEIRNELVRKIKETLAIYE